MAAGAGLELGALPGEAVLPGAGDELGGGLELGVEA
jgi:hypothetical protein